MSGIKLHFKSFKQFNNFEIIRLLLLIPLRKLLSKSAKMLLTNKSIFDFLLQDGADTTKKGDSNIVKLKVIEKVQPVSALLRRNTTDLLIFDEIIRKKSYSPANNICKKLNIDVNYIIDAGANIGSATIYFKSLYPEATIISIEPETSNFNMLEENIRLNTFNKVYAVQAALWKTNGFVELKENFRGDKERELSFFVTATDENVGNSSVKAYSIDGIMQQYKIPHIDILKMDIEGSERYLFESPEDFTKLFMYTKILAVELHEEVVDKWMFVQNIQKAGLAHITFGEIMYVYKSI